MIRFYLQSAPSQPRSLSARPQTSSEIMIEWEEPTHLNGEVTHYVVTGTRDEDFISQRNYCLERKLSSIK